MHLGDLLGRLRSEDTGVEALLALGDVTLAAAVETAREGHGETAGDYVAGAVARFSRLASDEDWLGIVTAAGSAPDPAAACLSRMLRWSVARDLHRPCPDAPGFGRIGESGGAKPAGA